MQRNSFATGILALTIMAFAVFPIYANAGEEPTPTLYETTEATPELIMEPAPEEVTTTSGEVELINEDVTEQINEETPAEETTDNSGLSPIAVGAGVAVFVVGLAAFGVMQMRKGE